MVSCVKTTACCAKLHKCDGVLFVNATHVVKRCVCATVCYVSVVARLYERDVALTQIALSWHHQRTCIFWFISHYIYRLQLLVCIWWMKSLRPKEFSITELWCMRFSELYTWNIYTPNNLICYKNYAKVDIIVLRRKIPIEGLKKCRFYLINKNPEIFLKFI